MNAWTACMPGITGMWVFPLLFVLIMIGLAIMFWRRGMMAGCGMMGTMDTKAHGSFLIVAMLEENSTKSNMTR